MGSKLIVEVLKTPQILRGQNLQTLTWLDRLIDFEEFVFETSKIVELTMAESTEINIQRLASLIEDPLQTHMNVTIVVDGNPIRKLAIHKVSKTPVVSGEKSPLYEDAAKQDMAQSIIETVNSEIKRFGNSNELFPDFIMSRILKRVTDQMLITQRLEDIMQYT